MTTVSHQEFLATHLATPKHAADYLNAIAAEGDLALLLKALRKVVEAQGGVGALARKTGLGRTSLYKTLSASGNPEIATLDKILKVFGLRVAFASAA